MPTTSLDLSTDRVPAWFCLRSQAKHEHIAAAHLRLTEGVEVFLPRIRFKRALSCGTAWVTEALFPGYLFARLETRDSLRQVRHARGVQGVVHFGSNWPVIPESVMNDLRQTMGTEDLHTIHPELFVGDVVRIGDGTFRGLEAVVSRIMPGRERIAVLMDLLGRQTTIELPVDALVREGAARAVLLEEPCISA